jgi:hypothetical protein
MASFSTIPLLLIRLGPHFAHGEPVFDPGLPINIATPPFLLTAVIRTDGQLKLPCLGNHSFVPMAVDRGNHLCYRLLAVHKHLWPNQVPQPE